MTILRLQYFFQIFKQNRKSILLIFRMIFVLECETKSCLEFYCAYDEKKILARNSNFGDAVLQFEFRAKIFFSSYAQ